MTSVGFDRQTGQLLLGWDHTRQSIEVIVTTEIGSRVQRREFGSFVPGLIDKPQNLDTLMDFYMAVAEALEVRTVDGAEFGEPRFQVTSIQMLPSVDGLVTLTLDGDYFPNGHRGDFSRTETIRGVAVNL